jgi:hypothetical protein
MEGSIVEVQQHGFYEQITEEYFAPEDLAEIEEGFAQIQRGEYVTLEEMDKELGL